MATEIRQTARDFFRDVLALSPMATGGNLPYRRLCKYFGADLTCSEMVVADKLVRGARSEAPLLRSHPTEDRFGIQLCGKSPAVMAAAAQRAAAAGCRFIDLNFGCPIELIVRQGAGSALLKRPARLSQVVAAVREATNLPLSVKIRLGWSQKCINAVKVAQICQEAGSDAVGVHGRTREQHYKRSADWQAIDAVAVALDIPVLGNGDLLTTWDLQLRRRTTAVASFLVARGALIKPWIFQELRTGCAHFPSPAQRWAVMRRYHDYAIEYFGDDDRGVARVERFFKWHLRFWHRYRPYSEADWQELQPSSLIQLRDAPVTSGSSDTILLASHREEDHVLIWQRVRAGDYPADEGDLRTPAG